MNLWDKLVDSEFPVCGFPYGRQQTQVYVEVNPVLIKEDTTAALYPPAGINT